MNKVVIMLIGLISLLLSDEVKALHNTLYNVKDFGAKGNYDKLTRKGADDVDAFKKALEKGSITIPKGLYFFSLTDSSKSLSIPSNRIISFEPGAVIVFGMKDIYFPAFVIVGKKNIQITNSSFLWQGKLTCGTGLDNLDEDGNTTKSKRYNSHYEYENRTYCSAIWIVESKDIHIEKFNGESITKDGNSVIGNWIFAARVDSLSVNNAVMNDMTIGIMSQGGEGGKLSNISAERMSQDIGILGHVIYSFRNNCLIENVNDKGVETGFKKNKLIGFTVSQKGSNSVIHGIYSRRAFGPLGLQFGNSNNFSLIRWKENDKYVINNSPKIFLPSAGSIGGNKLIIGDDVIMEATRSSCSELFGGEVFESNFTNFVLIRNDEMMTKNGFLKLKGTNNVIRAKLIEKGGHQADVVSNFNGNALYNKFFLQLVGFNDTPVFNVATGANYNEFLIDSLYLKDKIQKSFGSQKKLYGNLPVTDSRMTTNFIGFDSTSSSYSENLAPSDYLSAFCPITPGTNFVTLKVTTNNGSWSKTGSFKILFNEDGASVLKVLKLGSDNTKGSNFLDSLNLTVSNKRILAFSSPISMKARKFQYIVTWTLKREHPIQQLYNESKSKK